METGDPPQNNSNAHSKVKLSVFREDDRASGISPTLRNTTPNWKMLRATGIVFIQVEISDRLQREPPDLRRGRVGCSKSHQSAVQGYDSSATTTAKIRPGVILLGQYRPYNGSCSGFVEHAYAVPRSTAP